MEWWVQLAEVLSRLGAICGGAIALFLAWRRVSAANDQAEAQRQQAEASTRQAELGRHKLVGELFQLAVGQINDEKLEIRLFAVYSLIRIANEHPDYKLAVYEVMTAVMRSNSHKWGDADPPKDVVEMLRFLEKSLASDE